MGLTKQQTTMVMVLLAGALLVVLNQTLLTPALPTIMSHLDVNATTVQWLTSGYSLTEAVIIPLNAFLLGKFSTRKLFIGSLTLFTLGSIFCACAPNFPLLLCGRICQAIATGIAMPTVFALILLIFPRENRGSAMGLVGLVISFAPAVGPSISGVLVDSIGWRMLFVLVAVLASIVVVTSFFALKNFTGFNSVAIDIPSIVLLAAGMISLLYGISISTSSSNPVMPVLLICAGLIVLAFFVRRQLHLDTPILNVRVLAQREFSIATVVIVVLEAVLIGSGVILPIYIQNGLGEPATISGLLMLPGAVCGAAFGLMAGKLFDRAGIRGIAITGACVLIAGVVGYILLSAQSSLLMVCLSYTVACIGLQCLVTPVNTWGLNALSNRSLPHGNAIVSTAEQVGSSLGTAFIVSLTALSTLIVPVTSSTAEQTFAGCHIAFCGLLGLALVIGFIIVCFMRDKPVHTASSEHIDTPGIDREWLVADMMNTSSDVLNESSTVGDAIAIMQRSETGGLPIVKDDGIVVGFISDGDILKRLAFHSTWRDDDDNGYRLLFETEGLHKRLETMSNMKALDLATKDVVSVDASASAECTFKMLAEQRLKKVPVLREGVYVGTLSRLNVIKALQLPLL